MTEKRETQSRVLGVTSAKQRKCLPLALYTPLHTENTYTTYTNAYII